MPTTRERKREPPVQWKWCTKWMVSEILQPALLNWIALGILYVIWWLVFSFLIFTAKEMDEKLKEDVSGNMSANLILSTTSRIIADHIILCCFRLLNVIAQLCSDSRRQNRGRATEESGRSQKEWQNRNSGHTGIFCRVARKEAKEESRSSSSKFQRWSRNF